MVFPRLRSQDIQDSVELPPPVTASQAAEPVTGHGRKENIYGFNGSKCGFCHGLMVISGE